MYADPNLVLFKTVYFLKQWNKDPVRMTQQADKILEALQKATATKALSDAGSLPTESSINTCYRQLAQSFEPQYGGFGGAPKFPQPGKANNKKVSGLWS